MTQNALMCDVCNLFFVDLAIFFFNAAKFSLKKQQQQLNLYAVKLRKTRSIDAANNLDCKTQRTEYLTRKKKHVSTVASLVASIFICNSAILFSFYFFQTSLTKLYSRNQNRTRIYKNHIILRFDL